MFCVLTVLKLYCNTMIYKELIDSQLTKEHFHPGDLSLGFWWQGKRDLQVCHWLSLALLPVPEEGCSSHEQREKVTSASRWPDFCWWFCLYIVSRLARLQVFTQLRFVLLMHSRNINEVYPLHTRSCVKDPKMIQRWFLLSKSSQPSANDRCYTMSSDSTHRELSDDPCRNTKTISKASWATEAVARLSSPGPLQSPFGWFWVVMSHIKSPALLTQGKGLTLPLTFCSLIFTQPADERNPDIWEWKTFPSHKTQNVPFSDTGTIINLLG